VLIQVIGLTHWLSHCLHSHAPTHGTREVLIIFGALSSSDPGDIHQTISSLITDKIQVRVVGLAAQVAVCKELVIKTNNGDDCKKSFYDISHKLASQFF